MAGIYIHIPFCKQACHYCDFHFSTNLSLKKSLSSAIAKEAEKQKEYLNGASINTIYLGGGTPSLLNEAEIGEIFNALYKHYSIDKDAEITLEANPDDLDIDTIKLFQRNNINRLSIGIQSFNDGFLKYLNRAHDGKAARDCVSIAQSGGFENISIDLIYGIPHQDHEVWMSDLAMALSLDVQHISSYCLTIEPGTAFGNWKEKGKLKVADDEFTAFQFETLIHTLSAKGFEQYEISNFSKIGSISKHNSNYWFGAHYLGIGPGAHSYNGLSRQYNVSDNKKYIDSILNNSIPFSIEVLKEKDKVNEYLLTSLRTIWGCEVHKLVQEGYSLKEYFLPKITKMSAAGLIDYKNNKITLTLKGKLLADQVIAELFI